MNLQDLIDFIVESDLEDNEKLWLCKNLKHIEDKFREKFDKDLEL